MGHHDEENSDDADTVLSEKASSLSLVEKTSGEIDDPFLEPPPPLPPIKAREIVQEVFMHRSVLARPAAMFEDGPNDVLFPDNERLEHLGDAVLQLCATMLIKEMYPTLRVGPASKVRMRVVNNAALAKHTERYGLNLKLAVSHAQERQLRKSIAVQGDLFEAYVGGVFEDRGRSLPEVYDWLKSLLEPVVRRAYEQERADHLVINSAPSSVSESRVGGRSSVLTDDLSPPSIEGRATGLVTLPEIHEPPSPTSTATPSLISTNSTIPSSMSSVSSVYSAIRTPPPRINSAPPSPYRFVPAQTESGQLSYFNQCLMQRGKMVDWKFEERGGNKTTPLWAVEAWVRNEQGVEEIVGKAQAPTKKAAKNEAARQAIARLKYA